MTPQQRLVVAIAVLGSFVAFLDGTVVNVALPAIARELGGGLSTQQWTVDAYLVTLGAPLLVAGAAWGKPDARSRGARALASAVALKKSGGRVPRCERGPWDEGAMGCGRPWR